MAESIRSAQRELYDLFTTIVSGRAAPAKPAAATVAPQPISADDAELLELGKRQLGATFRKLIEGNRSGYKGSASDSDFGLAKDLLHLTGHDEDRTERTMRSLPLARAKWDTRRGEVTWLRYTIANARKELKTNGHSSQQAPIVDPQIWPKLEVDPSAAGPANGHCSPHCDRHLEVIAAQSKQISERDQVIAVQRERIAKLMAEVNANSGRFSNLTEWRQANNFSGKRKDVIDALAIEIDAARKHDKSEITLYYGDRQARKEGRDPGGIAGQAQTSPSTVEATVDVLRLQQDAPWKFNTVRIPETGHLRVVATFDPNGDLASDLAAVAALPRVAAQHGGFRPRCPDHPNAALIVQTICADCGQIVNQTTSQPGPDPLQQDAARPPDPHERGSTVTMMQPETARGSALPSLADPCQHDAASSTDPMVEALERIRKRRRGDVPPDDPAADRVQEAVSEAWNWRPEAESDEEVPPEPFDLQEEIATADPAPLRYPPSAPRCRDCGTREAGPGGHYCGPCMEAFYEANPWARAATAKAGAA